MMISNSSIARRRLSMHPVLQFLMTMFGYLVEMLLEISIQRDKFVMSFMIKKVIDLELNHLLSFKWSKIEGCQLKRQGNLPFNLDGGICGTFKFGPNSTSQVLLCFDWEATKSCYLLVVKIVENEFIHN